MIIRLLQKGLLCGLGHDSQGMCCRATEMGVAIF